MTSRVAYPTFVLTDECIIPSVWEIICSDGTLLPVGEYLPDWDYSVTIRLRRRLEVDWARVTNALDCGDDINLTAVVKVGTGQGRLPRSIIYSVSHDLCSEQTNAQFDLALHGSELSTILDLTVDIILAAPSERSTDLTPTRQGSRIWRETVRMRLEGEEPRFPIEVADFGLMLGTSAATLSPWYLHWSPRDWTRDFHGSMRLYLNADHKKMISQVEAEDGEVLRAIMADVMGQVCECLVRDVEIASYLESCEEGSLGRQAISWLNLAFPRCDLEQARAIIETRPGEFRAAFQAVADMGGSN